MAARSVPKKTKMNKFNDIINSENPVLVDFFATWCGPCQMLSPVLKLVKDNLGERITIIKIDVDKNQELASQYQDRSVPTMMLFKEGKQLWRQSGVLSKEEIIRIILDKINNQIKCYMPITNKFYIYEKKYGDG